MSPALDSVQPPAPILTLVPYAPADRTATHVLRILVYGAAVVALVVASGWIARRFFGGNTLVRLSIFFGALLVGRATVGLIGAWRRRCRLARLLALHHDDPPEQLLAGMLEQFATKRDEVSDWLANALSAAGEIHDLRGRTCVAMTRDEASRVSIVTMPFELLPLDERDQRLRTLAASLSSPAGETPGPDASPRPLGWRTTWWHWRGVLTTLVWLIVALWVGSWLLAALTALPLALAVASYRARETIYGEGTGERWHVVPGGVAILEPAGQAWTVQILPRRDAALLAYPLTPARRRWGVVVCDDQRAYKRTVTPMELHMLLAAWLSPLEPPEPQRLSDLTGRGHRDD